MSVLRKRLARKIEDSFPGCTVDPDDLIPATGSWRTNIGLDVYRWEGVMTVDGSRRCIGSYQTMTELVKCSSLEIGNYTRGEVHGT